jgi:hypothetical protein
MKLELKPDGYERIEAGIREIENIAHDRCFSDNGAVNRFHQITLEVKKLRQTLVEVILLNPKVKTEGPEAA